MLSVLCFFFGDILKKWRSLGRVETACHPVRRDGLMEGLSFAGLGSLKKALAVGRSVGFHPRKVGDLIWDQPGDIWTFIAG